MTSGYTDEGRAHIAQVRAARGWTEDYEVAADTVSQTKAQREWGEIVSRVRSGEVVTVTNHGRPDVVVIAAHEYADLLRDLEEMKGSIRRES